MPKRLPVVRPEIAVNNTVKLSVVLQQRVTSAMSVEGFTVWSEFCRVALTEKCHLIEDHLRARDPVEFRRVYPEVFLRSGALTTKEKP